MMRSFAFLWFGIVAGLLLLSVPLSGQSGSGENVSRDNSNDGQMHLGYPQDWSSQHLVMPGSQVEDVRSAGARDPRHVYNFVMRQVAAENARIAQFQPIGLLPPSRQTNIDWAVSLENGYVPQNQFPAKYGFTLGAESCNSDYVVFGLTVTTGTQANLVGINNLYTEAIPACNSGSPWVAFAYNTVTHTGGQIKTSPVLSEDGTKVAFVESTSSASYFHVLVLPNPIPMPPSQTGTVLSPQSPTSCTKPTTAGCMTTVAIESSATNSNSSPWVDYSADTAYVGADNGLLYKITPIFGGGAPALVNDPSNWPVTLSASTQTNKILTAPVEDATSGRIFVGDGGGWLYAVSLTNPGKTYSSQQAIGWIYDGTSDGSGGPGAGVVDPPIVVRDPANPTTNQVFSFTGCSSVVGIGGAVTQLPANFTNSSTPTTANTVDLGSGSGDGDCTTGNVHQGAFDNAFWLQGTASGHMITCGFVDGSASAPLIPSNPQLYFFPFANNIITSLLESTLVVNTTKGDECSPLTEFYNGITDRVFFGVGGSSDGHVESSIVTGLLSTPVCTGISLTCVTAPSALGGTSGIVIDNLLANGGSNIYFSTLAAGSVNGQKCNVSGGAQNPYCAVKLTQSGLR
jgi:hypothetical protein